MAIANRRLNPLGLLPLAVALAGGSGGPVAEVAAHAERSDLSLAFEAADDDELIHRGPGYELRVSAGEASLRFGDTACLRFLGSGASQGPAGAEPFAARALDYDAGAGGPRRDAPIYRLVRGADHADWRATASGVSVASHPGTRWMIEGADSVVIENALAVFQCPAGTVTLTAPGAGLRVLGDATVELVLGSEAALDISPRPAGSPTSDDEVHVTVDAQGFRYLAGRAPGGDGVPPVFVTKLAPDDATVDWTLRFDPGDDYRLTGIELAASNGVEVLGAQGSDLTVTSFAPDGGALHVGRVRAPGLPRARAPAPALGTRWGGGARVRSFANHGDTVVVAGTTTERFLPGATIVQPDARGENVFLATVPSVPEAPQTAGCPGTINFDNSAGTGAWTTATNWDLDRLPDPTDDVCIGPGFSVALSSGTQSIQSLTTGAAATLTLSGTVTLNLASASTIGGALTMTNGTLGGAGDVTISGLFTWGTGTLTGGGTTHANGGISFTGTAAKDLDPRVLENNATAAWASTGNIRLGGGSSIVNNGTWDAQGNGQMPALVGGGTFTNAGTFKKSGGTGTTSIAVGFDSSGPIDIQAGTLSINGSGTASGAITGSAATTLRFNGSSATYTLSASSSVAVPTVIFDAGTVDIHGSYAATLGTTVSGAVSHFNPTATVTSIGSLTISTGMADFSSGETIAPSTMTLSNGTLLGTDTVTIPGLLTWTAGTMTGSGVTNANGGIAFSNSSVKDLTGRVLRNAGTATWAGTGSIRLGGGATLENNGTFDAQGDGQIVALAGGGTVTNNGTLRKSTGAGATTIAVPLDSSGPIEILAGTLTLSGGGTASSTVTGSPSTTLRFSSVSAPFTLSSSSSVAASSVTFDGGTVDVNGTYAASATTTIGGGTNRFNPQATVVSIGSNLTLTGGSAEFNSGEVIAPTTMTMSNGTLQGGDTVTISGLLTWSAGTISGTGIVNANGGIAMSNSAVKDLSSRLLRNAGTATWAGTGALRMGAGATLENNGIWDMQGDSSMVLLGGGATVTSSGTFRKSAGTGTTSIAVPFDASGPVEIQSGTLSFDGGATLSSTIAGSSGVTLRFGGSATTNTLTSTSSVSVPLVVFAAGATDVSGAYAVTAGTTVVTGTFSVLPSATVSSIGSALTVTGGSASFASGETISPTTLSMSGGTILGTDTIDVSGITTWTAGSMSGGGITNTNGGLAMTGSAVRDLDARTLRTAGTTTWSGSGSVRLGGASTIENFGTWEISGDGMMVATTGGGSFANAGTFRKSGGVAATTVSVPFTTSGNVIAGVSSLSFTAGYTQTAGATTQSGGTISSTTPLDIQGGTLAGIGTVATSVLCAGTASPGLSPGILGISGAYTSSPTAHVAVELGGTTVGTQYDQLNVTGASSIDGTLDASLVGGFVPIAGDLFTIVSGASRTGTFTTTNLPSLPPFLVWNVIYLPTAVQLKAVPLPSGRVPGDNALEPPLTVAKSGANITLTWSAGCLATDADSEIYEGTLGNFTSHVPIACTTAGATTSTFAPGAGSRYYLVVPTNSAGEGSYGLGAGGAQRPASAAACHLQSIAACP